MLSLHQFLSGICIFCYVSNGIISKKHVCKDSLMTALLQNQNLYSKL